jgi:putative multicomponent Na+:H+ antiporter subunit B
MIDSAIYAIIALLPLTAMLVTVQKNPYHALVTRGILGAIAALTYAALGAVDVALTEALVGTLLAITLYAVAVRSSLVMRIGVLDGSVLDKNILDKSVLDDSNSYELNASEKPSNQKLPDELLNQFRSVAAKYHLRLELIPFIDGRSLQQALQSKEVHVICSPLNLLDTQANHPTLNYQTITRIRRLHDIFQAEMSSLNTSVPHSSYMSVSNSDLTM